MEIAKRKNISLQLNVTPLIDIVFLLLIFFMLTSTFMKEKAVELILPQSNSAQPTKEETVRLSVTSAGDYFLNGTKLGQQELVAKLKVLHSGNKQHIPALVQIDNTADVQLLVSAMDILKDAGFYNISLATEEAHSIIEQR